VDATQAAREKGKRKEDADGRKEEVEEQALDFAVPEITVERRVGRGWLSMDAVVAIEQFARCVHSPSNSMLSYYYGFNCYLVCTQHEQISGHMLTFHIKMIASLHADYRR
jgi:hypothetical protein